MSRKPAVRRSIATAHVQDVPDARDRDTWPLQLAELAVATLIEEAELTPKPALVDQRGSGAHRDLDLDRVKRSAMALKDGFAAIARASAAAARPTEELREQLGRIGRDMEKRMLVATEGSNAHRGAIWALGLLVAAAARRRADRNAVSIVAIAAALAAMPDRHAPDTLTHGVRARMRYGAAGARGEAQSAFPHVIRVGLPTLRGARERGIPENEARLDTLLAIMATLEDTCLLFRGGRAALGAAQTGARAVLEAGGSSTREGRNRLEKLDAALIELWASPGGSADLLSVTLFLDRLQSGDA